MSGPQQNFLFPFRWTHSGLFCYYVSVTNLGYIWVYLDPFRPIFVNSGERDQTALYGRAYGRAYFLCVETDRD